jgi:hypothetical protein
MNKIIPILLIFTDFLVTMPFAANALDRQEISLSLVRERNTLPAQERPPYAIGYTVYYRIPLGRRWTLEGFHAERRDAELAARRLQRSGFRTKIHSLADAERRSRYY